LDVDRPGVMVSLDGVDRDVRAVESSLNREGDVASGVADLRVVVGPHVVRGVVASPEEKIRLDLISHKVKHVLKGGRW